MPDCNAGCSTAMADSQIYNQKLLQDCSAVALLSTVLNSSIIAQQAVIDNQADARRRMFLAASVDGANFVNNTTADQTGATQNQQPNNPIRTAAADSTVQQPAGAAYPPIRNVDQGASTANNGIMAAMQDLAAGMSRLQDALQTAVLRSSGTGAAAAGSPQPAA